MANKFVKFVADTVALAKYGKVLRRLVEFVSTPGLAYTKHQDAAGLPYYYSCDGIGEAVADNIVIADTVEGTLVTKIGDSAFVDLTTLKSVTIPDSVTYIGGSAFAGCSSLNSIEIPEGVTSIEGATFNNCTYLMRVIIPASVTSIGGAAFYNCNLALGIYYRGTQEQWENIPKGQHWNNNGCTVHYNWRGGLPVMPAVASLEETE